MNASKKDAWSRAVEDAAYQVVPHREQHVAGEDREREREKRQAPRQLQEPVVEVADDEARDRPMTQNHEPCWNTRRRAGWQVGRPEAGWKARPSASRYGMVPRAMLEQPPPTDVTMQQLVDVLPPRIWYLTSNGSDMWCKRPYGFLFR